MNKKPRVIFKKVLQIGINLEKQQFELEDKFTELTLSEQTAVLGMLSSMLHNYQHIHAENHNKATFVGKVKN